MTDFIKLKLNDTSEKLSIKLNDLEINKNVISYKISKNTKEKILELELKMIVIPEDIIVDTKKAILK